MGHLFQGLVPRLLLGLCLPALKCARHLNQNFRILDEILTDDLLN